MTMSRSEAGKLGAEKARETVKKAYEDRIKHYNENKSICTHCNAPLEYESRHNKFCNQSCSASFHNEKKKKYNYCIHCGSLAQGKNRKPNQKYCSTKCQQAFVKEARYKEMLAGVSSGMKNASIRKLLIEKHGAKCMSCDWDKINPTTGKCPIELEHVDGDSTNNSLDNLKLLCPNCHSLTPTYKALNKGKGRHSRMQRYKVGKSY